MTSPKRSRRAPVFVRGSLERDRNPSVERAVHAEAVIDLGGQAVRARAGARTATEAIDLLARRLRREPREQQERQRARYRRPPRQMP